MRTRADGSGEFTRVILHPRVAITAGSDPETAHILHARAHAKCFIARSVNFLVEHEAEIVRG